MESLRPRQFMQTLLWLKIIPIIIISLKSVKSDSNLLLYSKIKSPIAELVDYCKESKTFDTLVLTSGVIETIPWIATLDDPKILPTRNSTKSNKHTWTGFPHIVFMILSNEGDSSNSYEESKAFLKAISNRRRDYFIFISESFVQMKDFFLSSHAQRIQNKFGVYNNQISNSHSSLLIEDPLWQNGLRELTETSQLPPSKHLLGHNLNGRHIRCSGALIGSYIFTTDKPNRYGEKLDGTHYRVISEASEKFNYTFESYAPLQSYGTLLKNGTWIGLLSDILYEERNYDVGYNLAHVLIWNDHVDYVATMSQARVSFVTRHPQSLTLRMTAFLSPFQLSLWILLCLTFFYVSFSIFFCLKFIPSIDNQQVHLSTYQILYISCILPYSILMEQGLVIPPRTKWISALWLLCVMIIGTGYRSNLVSYLSIPLKETIPHDMEELSQRKDYTVTLNVIGVVEKLFFKQTELKRAKEISKRLKYEEDTSKCVRRALVNPNKEACLGWDQAIFLTTSSSFTLESRIAPLFASPDGFTAVYLTLGIRKDSKYLDGIKSISYAFLESGITQKWQSEVDLLFKEKGQEAMRKEKERNSLAYKIVKQYIDEQAGSSIKPFKIDNLFVCFVILAIGSVVSLIIYVMEFICFKVSKDRVFKSRLF